MVIFPDHGVKKLFQQTKAVFYLLMHPILNVLSQDSKNMFSSMETLQVTSVTLASQMGEYSPSGFIPASY